MSLFPSAYFPSIAYLKLLNEHPNAQLESCENFVKQSIRNRCEILTANGKLKLVVPVKHNHNKKISTGQIQIDYSTRWQQMHWRAIQSAYAHAPYFEAYDSEINECIFAKHKLLIEKNEAILTLLCRLLDLSFKINHTKIYLSESKNDYRMHDFLSPFEETKIYQQVFSYEKPFQANLSALDVLFNEGPFARNWILKDQI